VRGRFVDCRYGALPALSEPREPKSRCLWSPRKGGLGPRLSLPAANSSSLSPEVLPRSMAAVIDLCLASMRVPRHANRGIRRTVGRKAPGCSMIRRMRSLCVCDDACVLPFAFTAELFGGPCTRRVVPAALLRADWVLNHPKVSKNHSHRGAEHHPNKERAPRPRVHRSASCRSYSTPE
jgi:hypothetical protein